VAADRSSQSTVLGGNLYQGNFNNLRNVTVGDFPIQLANDEPLFVDFENGNFYLEDGSRAIDSSVDSLEDRPELALVKEPMGIGLSPILAPNRDGIGQLRVDDPAVEPPEGFGRNVFKDRGALDRADFVGLTAVLIDPGDNDSGGIDRDPTESVVQLTDATLRVFSLQLVDGIDQSVRVEGTGVDHNTVAAAKVTLVQIENQSGVRRTLQEGVDYTFRYDSTNAVIRLTPLAGIWPTMHTYVMELDNSELAGIRDIAGNALRPNRSGGETQFTIQVGGLVDFGDAPDPTYPTLAASSGASHALVDGFFLGGSVDSEVDGQPTAAADGDGADEDGVNFNSLILVGTQASITVNASTAGMLDAWIDFTRDGDWNDAGEQIFTSQPLFAGANLFSIAIPAGVGQGNTFARFRLSSAGGLAPTGPADDGEVEDYQVTITTNPWQNSPNPLNVNDDPAEVVSPVDALVIINEINNRVYSDPVTGNLPVPPPVSPGPVAPYFYDASGDGFASALDALRVINFLNQLSLPASRSAVDTASVSPQPAKESQSGLWWVDSQSGSGTAAFAQPPGAMTVAMDGESFMHVLDTGTQVARRNNGAAARQRADSMHGALETAMQQRLGGVLEEISVEIGAALQGATAHEKVFAKLT
jgi:hypothetical protein